MTRGEGVNRLKVSSVFELWASYPLGRQRVRIAQADTVDELVERAEEFLGEGVITRWWVMEIRTTVSAEVVAVMDGEE